MVRLGRIVIVWAAVTAAAGVLAQTQAAYVWDLPTGFPRPRVPADNPMTPAKVELGRYLFYDTRLSGNGQQSCAVCHEQAKAFTDGKGRAVGSTGEVHPRGAMSLANVAYTSALTWGNPLQTRLEDQALVPMFGDHPIELGLEPPGTSMLARLRQVEAYRRLVPAAFPGDADPFTVANVTRALASFERTIISGRSPYDRCHYDGRRRCRRMRSEVFFSQPLPVSVSQRVHLLGATDSRGAARSRDLAPVSTTSRALSYPSPNTGITT